MKNLTLIFFLGIILSSCSNDKNITDEEINSDNKEFLVLFPESYPIDSFELQNGNSIVFYNDKKLKISEIDNFGEILWTKEHDLLIELFSNSLFQLDNLIYLYSSNSLGLNKIVFNLQGEIIDTELLYSEGSLMTKDSNFIYGFAFDYNILTNNTEITYRKYSLKGDFITEQSFVAELNGSSVDLYIKDNHIYIFGDYLLPNSYQNYYCKVYDFQGSILSTINTETSETKSFHSKLVLDNGNILLSVYNLQINGNLSYIDSYDLILYNRSGNLIKTKTINSDAFPLKLDLLSTDNIAVAGGRAGSLNGLKLSQLTIFDQNLNEFYSRNIGGYNNLDVFFKINESSNYYYVLGRTDDNSGDYDLPNNSTGADMFYYKLKK
ncbi:MAG: hypothetical protein K9J84_14270 [Bacteroidia bacterium]|nr:hypothetical protein [Bacteroidia bacterium]